MIPKGVSFQKDKFRIAFWQDTCDNLPMPEQKHDPSLDYAFPNVPARTLRVIQTLYRTRNLLWQRDRRHVEATGLSWGQAQVLIALLRAAPDHRLSPTQLCDEVRASSGGMTKMLAGLEAFGDVTRIPDPEDGRSRLVQLSDAGMARVTATAGTLGAANTELLAASLTPDEQDALADALERLAEAMEGRE